jgi:hypothetical protein
LPSDLLNDTVYIIGTDTYITSNDAKELLVITNWCFPSDHQLLKVIAKLTINNDYLYAVFNTTSVVWKSGNKEHKRDVPIVRIK